MIPYACDLPEGTIVISGFLKIEFTKTGVCAWRARGHNGAYTKIFDDAHIDQVLARGGSIQKWGE